MDRRSRQPCSGFGLSTAKSGARGDAFINQEADILSRIGWLPLMVNRVVGVPCEQIGGKSASGHQMQAVELDAVLLADPTVARTAFQYQYRYPPEAPASAPDDVRHSAPSRPSPAPRRDSGAPASGRGSGTRDGGGERRAVPGIGAMLDWFPSFRKQMYDENRSDSTPPGCAGVGMNPLSC